MSICWSKVGRRSALDLYLLRRRAPDFITIIGDIGRVGEFDMLHDLVGVIDLLDFPHR